MRVKQYNEAVLVDMDKFADRLQGYYPKISHKQAGRILNDVKFSAVNFEDDTGLDVVDLSQDDFFRLSEREKYEAYGTMVEMFFGASAEAELLAEQKD